ncbi:MAG: hypothetical protein K2R93_09860 [Gemmatimonadaceae bacterium]|nr:hypothetical protein [Gemmatimonadaceae bacterium]
MPIALRESFGAFAGGVEHAYALATLAWATTAGATAEVRLDDVRRRPDLDPESRLVALLQTLLRDAGYTLEELQREGFADTVLETARALRRLIV